MFTVKAIIPDEPLLDVAEILRATEDGLDEAAQETVQDFNRITETWAEKPTIDIVSQKLSRVVGTDNQIMDWVSNGTPSHSILPVNRRMLRFTQPFSPKTKPHVIGSEGGSRGDDVVFARRVFHPGVEARRFDEVIAQKYEDGRLQEIIQKHIDLAIDRK